MILYISFLYLQQLESSVAPVYCYFTEMQWLTLLYSVSAYSIISRQMDIVGTHKPPTITVHSCRL